MVEEFVTCPICNKKMKELNIHVYYKHGIQLEDFKKEYPDCKISVSKPAKKQECICEECNKFFETLHGYKVHMKTIHKIELSVKKRGLTLGDGIECLICNKKYKNIKQHVELKHKIKWEEYKEVYGYVGDAAYFSKEHKDKLSINKKKFYDSKKGDIQKEKQSILYSGNNNPAKRLEVRQKISDAQKTSSHFNTKKFKEKQSMKALTRIKNTEMFILGYGIYIKFNFNGQIYRTRSFEEFKVIYSLLENKIDFEYEDYKVSYIDDSGQTRNTLIDLCINKECYEIKSKSNIKKYLSSQKYKNINDSFIKHNKTYHVLSFDGLCSKFDIKCNIDFYFITKLKELMVCGNILSIVWSKHGKTFPHIIEQIDNNYENNPIIKISNFKIKKGDEND